MKQKRIIFLTLGLMACGQTQRILPKPLPEPLLVSIKAPPSQRHFVTTWDTRKPRHDPHRTIRVPDDATIRITVGEGVFKYDVDWNNDGIFDELNLDGDVDHTFARTGIHTIRIRGIFPHMKFGDGRMETTDSRKLMSVDQWGDIKWKSMASMFRGCRNLIFNASDTPNLQSVKSMSRMFQGATRFNSKVGHWNISYVKKIDRIFSGAQAFNQELQNWNTKNITTMDFAFSGTKSFNQKIGDWDTGRVQTFRGTFFQAKAFNQDLGRWDTSQATTMKWMFQDAISFNQPISDWNVSRVSDMSAMFYGASIFNQPLEKWDTKNVTDFDRMFIDASAFNQDLSAWSFDPKNPTLRGTK